MKTLKIYLEIILSQIHAINIPFFYNKNLSIITKSYTIFLFFILLYYLPYSLFFG